MHSQQNTALFLPFVSHTEISNPEGQGDWNGLEKKALNDISHKKIFVNLYTQ